MTALIEPLPGKKPKYISSGVKTIVNILAGTFSANLIGCSSCLNPYTRDRS